MAYTQSRDKITGEDLVPIQIWVKKKTHKALVKRAQKEDRSLKTMLRRELEKLTLSA